MIFLHLGAGAGDQDSRAKYRCGFTEFIKKNYKKNDLVYLVEANTKNIPKLKKCWQKYKNIKIINKAIFPKITKKKKISFFYCEEDAPHYQVFSLKRDHVKKHYPKSKTIKKVLVKIISLDLFLNKFFKNKTIDHLSIDLEGIDYEIIQNINFKKYSIKNISIEYLHLNRNQKINLIKLMNTNNYSYIGYGYDHNDFDLLFTKKKLFYNQILSKLIPYIKGKKIKHLNKLLIK